MPKTGLPPADPPPRVAAPRFVVSGERQGVAHVWAFCGPLCAAGWSTRAELEATTVVAG
jgi:hypothetical protein